MSSSFGAALIEGNGLWVGRSLQVSSRLSRYDGRTVGILLGNCKRRRPKEGDSSGRTAGLGCSGHFRFDNNQVASFDSSDSAPLLIEQCDFGRRCSIVRFETIVGKEKREKRNRFVYLGRTKRWLPTAF